MFFVLFFLADPVSASCRSFPTPDEFLVIGHAGGDPNTHCENSIEATRAALGDGANAIEIDLSVSKDGVIFLWHDPYPLSITALARRLGFTLSGRCQPEMRSNTPSPDLSFRSIRSMWSYESPGQSRPIVTLDEWLAEFASEENLKLVWLDVKVHEPLAIDLLAVNLQYLLSKYNVTDRVQFSVHSDDTGVLLQRSLQKHGLDPSRVVTDTVSLRPWVGGSAHVYDGVKKGILRCSCCANLGKPVFAHDEWKGFKRIVQHNLIQRRQHQVKNNSHIKVFVWTIDKEEEMAWLIRAGVDGIITNKPRLLANLLRTKKG